LGAWTPSFAQQNYTIEGQISTVPGRKIFLSSYFGEKTILVDSTVSDNEGHFSIRMKPGALTGMYRILWGKDKSVDLIWNKENIAFTTRIENPADSLKIQTSLENKVYRYYIQIDRSNQQKLDLLIPVIDYYPRTDLFYSRSAEEFETIQKNQSKLLDSLSRLYPSSFAVRIFETQETPFLPASLSKDARLSYLKLHFFDHVNFQDTLLLNSSVWANKAIAYLSLYGNANFDQKQLEAEFIKAVTIMLNAAAINAEVYKFILDYIVGGFDKYHFDGVITYIADNFQDPFSCEDQARKTTLQKKLDNFKKISIGKNAPEIEAPDPKGKIVKLSGIQSEYTLVIFYSSSCGHCAQMMPKVKEYYDKQKPKRVEVLAVSIDTSKSEWTKFLKEEKLEWIDVSELKGFNSKAADDYNIFATPTMFLLDREKKIVAKPISYRELDQSLRDLKLIR
jgi:peroxiredoxin